MSRQGGLSDAAVTRLRALGQRPELVSSRYAIVEEIGRGGMGTVYLAVDDELDREVAIKVPHIAPTSDVERRLRREAHVLAALEHPGIVPIHDVGTLADGRLFYVMKRVKGRTLSEHLRTVTDVDDRLRIFERICEPVAFAHAQGFIHRDLKPDNVMVGAFGEVMVMDWGASVVSRPSSVVSRRESSVASRGSSVGSRESAVASHESTVDSQLSADTVAGVVIGTVGFMSPEQERGEAIDARADVYGLGAILYLLLTDNLPEPAADPMIRLRQRRIPRPLAAVCARALAFERSHRYRTVVALSADVAAFRAGRAVDAYRETMIERLARFGRTYRTAILLVLGYIIMRTAVALLAGW